VPNVRLSRASLHILFIYQKIEFETVFPGTQRQGGPAEKLAPNADNFGIPVTQTEETADERG
jgi:hypothetical protein